MKKIAFIFIFVFSLGAAKGQFAGFSITGGMGTYDLSTLKTYHDALLPRMPVEVRGFDYFPPFTNIRITAFKQKTERLNYGLVFAYSATGAHANYTDYSGYLNFDQTISVYQLGITANYRLLNVDLGSTLFSVGGYGDLRLGYLRDKVFMNISTSYYYENNELLLSAVSPMAETGLEAMFHFSKVSLGLEGGLLYDTGAKLSEGNSSYSGTGVSLSPTNEVRSGMTGLRAGVKLILWMDQDLISE